MRDAKTSTGLAAALLIFSPISALGQQLITVKAGVESRLWGVYSCEGAVPYVAGRAEIGTVETRSVKSTTCGNVPHAQTVDLIYRPKPGFKGDDKVYFYNSGMLTRIFIVRVQ